MKSYFLSCLLLLVTSCAFATNDCAGSSNNTRVIPVSYFNDIAASGNVNIILADVPRSEGVHVMDKKFGGSMVNVSINNDILWVNLPARAETFLDNHKPVNVIVPVQNLSSLSVDLSNGANLFAVNVHLNLLNIRTADNSTARVQAPTWLNAIAVDQSQIWYYGKPDHSSIEALDAGSVIQQPYPNDVVMFNRCS